MAPSVEEVNESNEGTRLQKQDCHSLPNYDLCYGRRLFLQTTRFCYYFWNLERTRLFHMTFQFFSKHIKCFLCWNWMSSFLFTLMASSRIFFIKWTSFVSFLDIIQRFFDFFNVLNPGDGCTIVLGPIRYPKSCLNYFDLKKIDSFFWGTFLAGGLPYWFSRVPLPFFTYRRISNELILISKSNRSATFFSGSQNQSQFRPPPQVSRGTKRAWFVF